MAAMNYKTMSNFPVYVIDADAYAYYYGLEERDYDAYDLECDMWAALNDGLCDDEAAVDEVEKLNENLTLHTVSIEPGIHEGAQIYVKDLFAGEEGWTDAFTQYEFGMDVAEASRESEREHAEIVRWLNENAPRFGFYRIALRGVFNNGSGVWEKVA